METSILQTTKKLLGIDNVYTNFDQDILIFINTAFATLSQLGVGPEQGFYIEDDTATWSDFIGADAQLNLVQTYVYLKVRVLFDPPTASYVLTALQTQLQELEWRLNVKREGESWVSPIMIPTA